MPQIWPDFFLFFLLTSQRLNNKINIYIKKKNTIQRRKCVFVLLMLLLLCCRECDEGRPGQAEGSMECVVGTAPHKHNIHIRRALLLFSPIFTILFDLLIKLT